MSRKLATNLRFAMFPVVTHQSFNVKKQFSHKEKKSSHAEPQRTQRGKRLLSFNFFFVFS